MDRSIPNDDERKKLKKMSRYYSHLPIYFICLLSLSWVVGCSFEKPPILGFMLSIIIFLGMLLLLLNIALLKRCPRCSSWGTPVLGGNCPKCGLRLDHSYKQDKSRTAT